MDVPESTELLKSVRVLVIDDEEPIRLLVDSLLVRFGCHVETAPDARAGLRILLQRDFDVALFDLRMGAMSGSEFLQQARSIWPWLGLILLSGHADAEVRSYARQLGVSHILQKPVELTELVNAVRAEALEKKKRVEMSSRDTLDHIQDQLGLLRHFSEEALSVDHLEQAMQSLSIGLSKLLPCEAVAILNVQPDEQALYLSAVKPVSQEFIHEVEQQIFKRFEALGGTIPARDTLRILFDSSACDPDGPRTVESSFSIPIISGGEIKGLLALCAANPQAFGATYAAFMYHAANQLGIVLTALSRMRQLSVHDTLTRLYNRKGLDEEYLRVWRMVRRYKWSLGIAIIDLDDFKGLNDRYGHLVGDEILRSFADVVSKVARDSDIVARYGGDELVVILPQAGDSDCVAFGERILQTLRECRFCPAMNGGITVFASIGVASCRDAFDCTSAELLERADEALYEAKRTGRGRVCVYRAIPDSGGSVTEVSLPDPAPPKAGSILLVDDEESVCRMLMRLLTLRGYAVQAESNPEGALNALRDRPGYFDILLTDLNLGAASGLDLLEKTRPLDENLITIIITGNATLDNAVSALRRGAYDFIQKPVIADHLIATINRALDYRRLKQENIRYQNHLEEIVQEKHAALIAALAEVKSSYEFTLEAMASLLDARERSLARHSTRVRDLAVLIGRELPLPPSELDDLARGALLHDIGKMCIPDSVLLKPGILTPEERAVMNSHTEVGYQLLKSSAHLKRAAELVYAHHERFDGKGYPRGLKGVEIPIGARIFAVVDAYDAMRSDRVYRKAQSAANAKEEIMRHSGQQFDPAIVDLFVRCHSAVEKVGKWPCDRNDQSVA